MCAKSEFLAFKSRVSVCGRLWSVLVILGGIHSACVGQATPKESQPLHWTHWMQGGDVNLGEARAHFDNQTESRSESRSCGAKPFERWAWWMQERGGLKTRPKPESWWEASEAWRMNAAASATQSVNALSWSFVGPRDVPVHGGAGRINRLVIDPSDEDLWYACAPSGGLWHSVDAGGHWEVLGIDVLAPLGATDVWVDPNNSDHLWLATGDGNGGDTYSIGVLETWDAGMTWDPLELAFEPSQGRRIHAISPHPTDPLTLLVSTDLGVFKTNNGGTTFDLTLSGLTRDAIWLNDTAVVAAIESQGIRKSIDGGNTWSPRTLPEGNGLGRIQIAAEHVGPGESRDTLYAIGGQFFQQNFLAFWRSVDGGESWEAQITRITGPNLLGYTVTGADNAGQAFWDLCIEVDPEDANRVLTGGVNVWETMDGGVTWNCPIHWQGALEAKYAHADQHDIVFTSTGEAILANDGGVFVWNGDVVEDRSKGLDITQGYAIALNPLVQGQLLIGTQDNGTNLLKPDVEARILDGDGFEGFFDPNEQDRLYASAYYGLLYRSDDGGRTMSSIATYLQSSGPNELGAWQTPFQMHPGVPGRIVAAKKSLHHSDDGGNSWTTWDGMGTVRSTAMALTALDAEAALVAKNDDLHWRDSVSMSFETIAGLPGEYIGDVAIAPDNMSEWWVTFADYTEGIQVWRTLDQGETWENISDGLPALPIHRIVPLPDGQWVCGSDLGVHVWDEATGMWEHLGTGLPLAPIVDIDVDSLLSRLVISTYGRGVWSLPMPTAADLGAAVVQVIAPKTQCLGTLAGAAQIHGTGTSGLNEFACLLTASNGVNAVEDTLWVSLNDPLLPGQQVVLDAFQIDVPQPGSWELTLTLWSPEHGALGPEFKTQLWSSGLGHEMTLSWWGDCENVDMRWDLRESESNDLVLLSVPLAAGDTVQQTWCLTEGCYEILWSDQGGDGFSGSDCGEYGGFTLTGPFDEILASEEGTDFGNALTTSVCIDVPWCFADYNGDGMRSVDDLLVLLSDFGCIGSCEADNNQDASVGVSDLMGMLSVYGTSCF